MARARLGGRAAVSTGLSLCVGAAALLLSALAGLSFGAARVNLWAAVTLPQSADGLILLHVRLPRVLTTLLAGAALGAAGAILQCVLHNPLAAPNIIGVNAGAGFGATLCLALLPAASGAAVSAFAFAGAVLATALVCGVASRAGSSRLALVLAGVALSMLFSAGVDTLITVRPDCLPASSHFKIGSAANATLGAAVPPLVLVPVCLLAACALRHELDILALGDETALSLGANPKRLRAVFLAFACALAACAVSMMGLIGFVGLLAPHVVRLWVGGESGRVLPLSALLGAAFLTLCDLAARTLFAPFELPVGILLAALGAPFFLWLLIRRRSRDEA